MRYLGIGLVWAYRMTFGALFPTTCKYHPSCSQYAIDALRRYGLLRGSILAGWRLLRCHPWARGGVDRVEDQRLFKRGAVRQRHPEPLEARDLGAVFVAGEPPAGQSPAPAAVRLDPRERTKAQA